MFQSLNINLLLAIVFTLGLENGDLNADKAPNFIIFYMDDMSWNQTSFKMMDSEPESKHPFYETPHLEKLANRGMRFSNGYCPAPTCTPSRISIQFGQSPARIQYRFVHDVLSAYQRPNGYHDEMTMAEVLKAANKNYITAHFGKGAGSSVGKLRDSGYDVTDEYEKFGPNGNGHGDHLMGQDGRKPLPADDPKRIFSLTRSALKFLDNHAGKQPFFMMVSHYAAHSRIAALPKDIQYFQKKYDALNNKPTEKAKLNEFNRIYSVDFAAMLYEADWSLGEIMRIVKEKGELDNTYIIFTADNGAEWLPFDQNKRRYSGPLQMGKYSTFEGGLRVPFIVAGPGIQAGRQCDIPVIQWDILPTLHDLSGSSTPLPNVVDGGSLRDVFAHGNAGKVTRKAPGLIFHFPSYYQVPVSAIRIGDFKFMRNMNSGDIKLFNVAEDYRELKDLSNTMPEKAADMEKLLQDYLIKVNGGDVKDVYTAYYRWCDEIEKMESINYIKKTQLLEKEQPSDLEQQLKSLKDEHETKLRSLFVKREMVKDQTNSMSWYHTPRNETFKRLGMKKDGTIIK